MKKFKHLLIIVLALTLSISCSDDDDDMDNDDKLIGTWEMSEVEEDYEYNVLVTFKSNGAGTSVYVETFDGETETDSENFTWSTEGNKLTIMIDGDEETSIYSIQEIR